MACKTKIVSLARNHSPYSPHTKAPSANLDTNTYTYDKASNRITQIRSATTASLVPTAVTAANIAYDAANELTRWASATTNVTYDLNGNMQTEASGGVTTTYTWDSRNRLTGISRTGLTASFVYDGLGRRKSKTINGTTTGFWYDGNDIYAELTGVIPSFTYIRGLGIDEPYIRKGASDEFYHTDALGTALNLSNSTGAKTRTYTYEPFGTTVGSGTASTNTFQYTGRENDGTNLYYYRARYYHPKFQRFMGEDPIGFVGGFNFYAYVRNNAINNFDPLGLCVIGFTTQSGEDGIIIAATNEGKLSVGPFPATNRAKVPIPKGTYSFGQPRREGFNGVVTSDGLLPFEGGPRTRQEALGDAFVPIGPVTGRTGIGIHARFPDPGGRLKGTAGCIRVHNTDINDLADFIEQNCQNEANYIIKQ